MMLKKIAKSLDEMAKNEELMAGILEQADDNNNGAGNTHTDEVPVHPTDYLDNNPTAGGGGLVGGNSSNNIIKNSGRLLTIGEDKDEDLMQ